MLEDWTVVTRIVYSFGRNLPTLEMQFPDLATFGSLIPLTSYFSLLISHTLKKDLTRFLKSFLQAHAHAR